jgi:small subunit ribosomal protein S7
MSEIKLFNQWSFEGITVEDPGLKRYITLTPIVVPKTGARYIGNRFHKSSINIVERLINRIMVTGHRSKKHIITSGHHTGQGQRAMKIVEEALKIVEEKTKQNPILVLVKAIENAAPREEIIAIEYGGARYPKAVEVAPQRRVDLVLRYMGQGAFHKSFNKKKSMSRALADEILGAFNKDFQGATAMGKRHELERQADSSR